MPSCRPLLAALPRIARLCHLLVLIILRVAVLSRVTHATLIIFYPLLVAKSRHAQQQVSGQCRQVGGQALQVQRQPLQQEPTGKAAGSRGGARMGERGCKTLTWTITGSPVQHAVASQLGWARTEKPPSPSCASGGSPSSAARFTRALRQAMQPGQRGRQAAVSPWCGAGIAGARCSIPMPCCLRPAPLSR